MEINKIINGDALTELKKLPDESVNCVVTSPPYWNQRDYGIDGQLGLEKDFDSFINNLIKVFDEVKRVLKDSGTCFIVIDDTYWGSGAGTQYSPNLENSKEVYVMPYDSHKNTQRNKDSKFKAKCMCMIPERFAIKMIEHGWILRNKIIWKKNNAMPESSKDRFTNDYEFVYFFTKSRKYYFETQYEPTVEVFSEKRATRPESSKMKADYINGKAGNFTYNKIQPQGRNKRTVWSINTKPFKESHFAVFPEKLIEPMIKAGCPEFVCNKCGKPREIILKIETSYDESKYDRSGEGIILGRKKNPHGGLSSNWTKPKIEKVGLTDCSCNKGFGGGTVLDPFGGAGTTALVALKQNKKFILIELNKEYCKIAENRLEPYLLQSKLEVKDVK
jgi:DNA modification methylase